jgi:hypothetical protein
VEDAVRRLLGGQALSSVRARAPAVPLARDVRRVIAPVGIPTTPAVLLLKLTVVRARPRIRALALVARVGARLQALRLRVHLGRHRTTVSVEAGPVSQLRLRGPSVLVGVGRRAGGPEGRRGALAGNGARAAVAALGCAATGLPGRVPLKRCAQWLALEGHGPLQMHRRQGKDRTSGVIHGRGSRRRGVRVDLLPAGLS